MHLAAPGYEQTVDVNQFMAFYLMLSSIVRNAGSALAKEVINYYGKMQGLPFTRIIFLRFKNTGHIIYYL